jgi:chemotaxis protein methyltransferase CheR
MKALGDGMSDADCVALLQWAAPRLALRWPGLRKVRRQVRRRLQARVRQLRLDGFAAYRARLEADPSEWRVLDACCRITISRFFRDRGVFEAVRRLVLPDIAARARREGRGARAWSAGCASGEEPYTLRIVWDLEVAPVVPGVALSVTASDVDEVMLERARRGCFEASSLRELPAPLVEPAFERQGGLYCVEPGRREGVEFVGQDLRTQAPEGPFDLILCRYLAFTYFAEPLQRRVLDGLLARLRPRGWLVIGTHESLPGETPELEPLARAPEIFRKR